MSKEVNDKRRRSERVKEKGENPNLVLLGHEQGENSNFHVGGGGQNSLSKSDLSVGPNGSFWQKWLELIYFFTWRLVFLVMLGGSWENTKRQHKLPFLSVFSQHSRPLAFPVKPLGNWTDKNANDYSIGR